MGQRTLVPPGYLPALHSATGTPVEWWLLVTHNASGFSETSPWSQLLCAVWFKLTETEREFRPLPGDDISNQSTVLDTICWMGYEACKRRARNDLVLLLTHWIAAETVP